MEAAEYQENIEHGSSNLNDVRVFTSKIGKACFKNNIHDFDIFENEEILQFNLENNKIRSIRTPNEVLKVISDIFVNNIKFRYKECCKFKKENGKLIEKSIGTYCERAKGNYVSKNCEYCKTDALELNLHGKLFDVCSISEVMIMSPFLRSNVLMNRLIAVLVF